MLVTETQPLKPLERLENSYKRSQKLTAARIKNGNYAQDVKEGLDEHDYLKADSPDTFKFLQKFQDNLCHCSAHSLYRQINGGRNVTFIGAKTCNHRLCNVCNMLRAKKLRRKFWSFFNSTEENIKVRKKHLNFFTGLDKENPKLSGAGLLKETDFMHLTLTVPHASGWNGFEYYAQQLIKRFHTLRKCKFWDDLVFGGEYSVETTSKNNSLHIHIHALLMVRKVQGSRNMLYTKILQKWNELTIDETLQEQPFTAERLEGLKAGLRFLKPKTYYIEMDGKKIFSENFLPDNEDPFFERNLKPVLSNLDARGSTMIGLKSLYYEVTPTEYARLKNSKFTENGRHYKYCNNNNTNSLLKGVLECLKYHFEPCSIEDAEGRVDVPLLTVLIPNIYRQRLYGKFGGLYGLSQLNIMEEPLNETDLIDDAVENASEAFDPQTGQPLERHQYSYIVADARSIIYDADKRQYYCDPDKVKFHIPSESSPTMLDAIKSFSMYAVEKITEDKRERYALSSLEKFE